MGKRCEIYMDHKSLKYIFTQLDLCECLNRNEKTSVWTSLWGYLGFNQDTIPSRLL
jgi:hypothetical protein